MPGQGASAVPGARGPGELIEALRPVKNSRLADRVVEQIQQFVLSQGVEPGERLPSERDLAASLGTSRAIVSQALRTLSLMGLVEVRPGSGAYVTRNPEAMMTASMDLVVRSQKESAHHLAQLRYWLEDVAARNALDRVDEADGLELEAAFDRLRASAGETSAWIAADTMFHAALVRAAGNPYLAALYEAVHTSVLSVMYERWVQLDVSPSWLTGSGLDAQLALHRPIIEAVATGDSEALAAALREHHGAVVEHLQQDDEQA